MASNEYHITYVSEGDRCAGNEQKVTKVVSLVKMEENLSSVSSSLELISESHSNLAVRVLSCNTNKTLTKHSSKKPFFQSKGICTDIFLISPWKHILWVLIRSVSKRRFQWLRNICFCEEIRKIHGHQIVSSTLIKARNFICSYEHMKLNQPGATPKKPASGLMALNCPFLSNFIQAMSSPTHVTL